MMVDLIRTVYLLQYLQIKKTELKTFFVKLNSPFKYVIVKMIQSGQSSKKRQMVIKSFAQEESLASYNIFCIIQAECV